MLLHLLKVLVKAFFSALKTYADTDISGIGQYWPGPEINKM